MDVATNMATAVLAEPPNPGAGKPPPGSAQQGVTQLLEWVAWIVFALAIAGVLITAGKLMINNRRGEGGEQAAALGWVCGGCIIAASASAIVGVFVT